MLEGSEAVPHQSNLAAAAACSRLKKAASTAAVQVGIGASAVVVQVAAAEHTIGLI